MKIKLMKLGSEHYVSSSHEKQTNKFQLVNLPLVCVTRFCAEEAATYTLS